MSIPATVPTAELPPAAVLDSSSDAASPITAAAGGRSRALRDVVSVLDYGAKGDGVNNDTTAIQTAINAVSATGGVLLFPPGRNFLCGVITPKSNVTCWGYGSKITSDGTPVGSLFLLVSATVLSQFKLLGFTFVAAGNEGAATGVFRVTTSATCNDVEVSDCYVSGWAGGPFYFGGAVRARAFRNTMINCGSNTGTNLINFVSIGAGNSQECIAIGNIAEGCATYTVAYVNTGQNTNQECRVIIADNYCGGNASAGVGSGGIDVEFASASIGEGSKFIIRGNIVNYTGSGSSPNYGIAINGSSGTDGALVNRVIVSDNVVDTTRDGIEMNCSQAVCSGNVVNFGTGVGILVGKSATGDNQYVVVSDNIVHAANTITGNAAIWLSHVTDCKVQGNYVIVDSGAASSTPNGIGVSGQTATRLEISDNTVIQAPRHGILVGGTDIDVRNNKVYNPSSQANSFQGIFLNSVSGNTQCVTGNKIIDDRGGSALMVNGVSSTSSASAEVRDNHIIGYTNVPINGTVGVKRGNRYSASGAVSGTAILSSGTATVNTVEVVSSDTILLSNVHVSGTAGALSVGTITNKISFVINSASGSDGSTVYWEIRH